MEEKGFWLKVPIGEKRESIRMYLYFFSIIDGWCSFVITFYSSAVREGCNLFFEVVSTFLVLNANDVIWISDVVFFSTGLFLFLM